LRIIEECRVKRRQMAVADGGAQPRGQRLGDRYLDRVPLLFNHVQNAPHPRLEQQVGTPHRRGHRRRISAHLRTSGRPLLRRRHILGGFQYPFHALPQRGRRSFEQQARQRHEGSSTISVASTIWRQSTPVTKSWMTHPLDLAVQIMELVYG